MPVPPTHSSPASKKYPRTKPYIYSCFFLCSRTSGVCTSVTSLRGGDEGPNVGGQGARGRREDCKERAHFWYVHLICNSPSGAHTSFSNSASGCDLLEVGWIVKHGTASLLTSHVHTQWSRATMLPVFHTAIITCSTLHTTCDNSCESFFTVTPCYSDCMQ